MTASETRNLTISGRLQNGSLRLIVEDSGCGIAAESVEKVFDPFFSTKDSEGVARGLGLNVVRRVVEELEGSVKIQSTEGSGTRVDIELPIDKDSIAAVELPHLENEDSVEFSVAGIPSVGFQEKEWPEISIRKPIVRTLD
jgi:K+-sensing histidine kinase KdpD